MEKEIKEYILLKLDELSELGISYPTEKTEVFYNSLIERNLPIEEAKEIVDKSFEKALNQKKEEILNIKAKKGEYSNFDSIMEAVRIILNSDIKSKITIYGGTVPYLITGEKPKRVIGDIDLHVSLDDMEEVRNCIKTNSDKFNILIDTKNYSQEDFGLEMKVNNVDVSIFPYVLKEEGKVVRNFQYEESSKKIIEKATMFYGLNEENSTIKTKIENEEVRLQKPEYTYIQKNVSLREKDRIDIEVLNKIVKQDEIDYLKKITKTPEKVYQKEIDCRYGINKSNEL